MRGEDEGHAANCRETTAFVLPDRRTGATLACIDLLDLPLESPFMKRSRRVVLTLMGSAALGAVAEGLQARPLYCGPGLTAVPGPDGRPYCRATYQGFGGTLRHFHGHAHGHGHGHAHAGG
jgi:hypothetical protein